MTQQSHRRKPGKGKGASHRRGGPDSHADNGHYWLYGTHPVHEALQNHRRDYHRLLATANAANKLGDTSPIEPEIVDRKALDKLLGRDTVHQGIALEVSPLAEPDLKKLLADESMARLVVLDQVTDPHNVGAIMRSAAAFGASAIVTTWRHSPPETATLAKTSAGLLEHMPYVRGQNLANQLEDIKDAGFTIIGLDADGDMTPRDLENSADGLPDRFALVMGAEGKGLRQRSQSLCDILLRLTMADTVESLNVSNAAAVALYALSRD